MVDTKIQMIGLQHLEKALREIAPQIKGNPLRNASRAMAKVVEDDARKRAPMGTDGIDDGRLKRAVAKKLIPLRERDQATMRGNSAEVYDVGVNVGKKSDKATAWYWWQVELGNENNAAQPFLRPALFNNKQQAINAFSEKLKRSLELAARKLAK